jgi:SNF2 family DNA or RNA helicase
MARMLALKFPYDPVLIERIKALPKRRYDAHRKAWLIPVELEGEARRILESWQAGTDTPPVPPRPAQWQVCTDPPPWPWQLAGLEYAFDKPAVLLDLYMGLGKTRVALDTIYNRDHKRVLVVCPKSVVPVWAQQVKRHTPPDTYRVVRLDTGVVPQNLQRAKAAMHKPKQQGVMLVVNYQSVWREPFATWALAQEWDCLILDEVHACKAPSGVTSRFLYRLGFRAQQRLGLSGTPLAHSPLDAYGVYRALDPVIFGTNFRKFQERYAILGGFGMRQVIGFQNMEEFAAKLNRIRYHVDRSVLILPPVRHLDYPVTLPGDVEELYAELDKEFYAEVASGEVTVQNVLVKILRLSQLTSGYVKLDDGRLESVHFSKVQALADIIDGIPLDEPVVVFCRFVADFENVCKVATSLGRQYCELSGARKELPRWQHTSGAVLGVQVSAGAEGIDLTHAAYGVFYSIGHSLAQYDQATARLHRPGQNRSVTYYHLVAEGTIDEKVYAALDKRRDIIASILAGDAE